VRIGQGADAHQLVAGRPLWLGGIEVPHDRGLEGHSDGDVLLHAVTNAVLGALGEGDLGRHFPSSDPGLEGVASADLLTRVARMMRGAGFSVGNVDATIVAQEPRLGAHLAKMQAVIADVLETQTQRVNVKVTSTDRMGFTGRGEGIAALAVVLLRSEGEGEA
jgi:2-C-methyl-D-erythritol 2,4-cyclodiphosphate synthase